MNGPIFAPANLTPSGRAATHKRIRAVAAPAVLPVPLPQVLPAFVCPSSPRSSNPFKEVGLESQETCGVYPSYYAGASDYTAVSCYCCRFEVCLQQRGQPERSAEKRELRLTRGGAQLELPSPRCGADHRRIDHRRDVDHDLLRGTGRATRLVATGREENCRATRHATGNLAPWPANEQRGFQIRQSNFGGCWGCMDNGWNELWGSTFDGTQFAPANATVACAINCTNQAKAQPVQFPSRLVRNPDVRRLGPHGEREPEHYHLVPSDHVQGTLGRHRQLLIRTANSQYERAGKPPGSRAGGLAISVTVPIRLTESRASAGLLNGHALVAQFSHVAETRGIL